MKTLGSATMAYNAIIQDYHVIETLNCLYDLSDEIAIAFGGTDGTIELVTNWYSNLELGGPHSKRVILIAFTESEWQAQRGREKLSYFSNLAINALSTDWVFYLQADEIIGQESFPFIRQAITFDVDGYLCARYNLWKDPKHMLNVPQERKPCSTEVIRLARKGTQAVGDAESITASRVHVFGKPNDVNAIHNIAIWHMGFVRDPVKHLEKIRHMQDEIFLIDHDKKIDGMVSFEPSAWFRDEDLVSVPGELPEYIRRWAKVRYPDLDI